MASTGTSCVDQVFLGPGSGVPLLFSMEKQFLELELVGDDDSRVIMCCSLVHKD